MRNIKRIGAGLLAGVLALSVVACGEKKEENTTSNVESTVEEKKELTIEERIAEASKKMENIESYESKMKLELGFEVSFGDEKSEVPMNIESEVIAFKNPEKTKFVVKVENPFTGEPEATEGYTIEKDGEIIEYQKNEGKWEVVKDGEEQYSLEDMNYMEMVTAFLKDGQNVKEIGNEDISGKQTTKAQIELNSDILKDKYKNDEMFEELLKSDGVSIIGEIWLTEDNDVVQCKVDLTSFLAEVSEEDAEEGRATKAIFTIALDQHNVATEFEIPEEVLKLEK